MSTYFRLFSKRVHIIWYGFLGGWRHSVSIFGVSGFCMQCMLYSFVQVESLWQHGNQFMICIFSFFPFSLLRTWFFLADPGCCWGTLCLWMACSPASELSLLSSFPQANVWSCEFGSQAKVVRCLEAGSAGGSYSLNHIPSVSCWECVFATLTRSVSTLEMFEEKSAKPFKWRTHIEGLCSSDIWNKSLNWFGLMTATALWQSSFLIPMEPLRTASVFCCCGPNDPGKRCFGSLWSA